MACCIERDRDLVVTNGALQVSLQVRGKPVAHGLLQCDLLSKLDDKLVVWQDLVGRGDRKVVIREVAVLLRVSQNCDVLKNSWCLH